MFLTIRPLLTLLAAAISVFVLPSAQAADRIDCSSLESKILHRAVRYCVEVPSGYDDAKDHRYQILYFLHGLGDDEQTLFKTGGWTLIEDLRKQKKIGEFLIVAPDGGRSFFINSADGRLSSASATRMRNSCS